MKKYIAAIGALVALAVPTAAMAASTDANGDIIVTKGDVQSAMGWNNEQFQAKLADVPGLITGTADFTRHHIATCASGGSWELNVTERWGGVPVSVKELTNAQNKVTGYKVSASGTAMPTFNGQWSVLNGKGADAEVSRTVTDESKWCPDTIGYSDARWTGGVSAVQVNGVPSP